MSSNVAGLVSVFCKNPKIFWGAAPGLRGALGHAKVPPNKFSDCGNPELIYQHHRLLVDHDTADGDPRLIQIGEGGGRVSFAI